ncbi:MULTISPECIES: helix-turn-helix transcriptional regulator [Actinoalloteichus]|uniref:DNA-binding domain-containing protein, AraC-type n=1 Tax=Actinoalloteichus fjordicus TaxID=1612552 RepID=A0AAC9PQU1_9PSEU|nr:MULTISPECIES: AraC family transcriptional regulator [Actinoalloteichus]APU13282.1 DNA-binding domain-containing protein, AraC-type [Actinoalloteichus fjordicus]APU19233.1 DNA-binding domain-containing protein, AraC-type [Actinoalloteichus sp. GBA129-24]
MAVWETTRAVRRAKDVIDRDFAAPLDLDRLAAVAGYSRHHLSRRFRAIFGETPIAYLTRRRIERAAYLLRAANLTVTEVCFHVGFASLGSFSSRFHQLMGRSPSEYQRHHRARSTDIVIPGCFVLAWSRPGPDA